jgi:methylated-DNA-[protein]-cysteine S-methyltransferase
MTSCTNYTTTASPLGELLLAGDGRGVRLLRMLDSTPAPPPGDWVRDPRPFADALAQLREYFDGRRTSFDLPLDPHGHAFDLRVWDALREIPYGATISYGELARRIGHPDGARAVGAANGRNPIPVIVPCHRVIGADGRLVGYGGGLERKRRLLELEAGVLSF